MAILAWALAIKTKQGTIQGIDSKAQGQEMDAEEIVTRHSVMEELHRQNSRNNKTCRHARKFDVRRIAKQNELGMMSAKMREQGTLSHNNATKNGSTHNDLPPRFLWTSLIVGGVGLLDQNHPPISTQGQSLHTSASGTFSGGAASVPAEQAATESLTTMTTTDNRSPGRGNNKNNNTRRKSR